MRWMLNGLSRPPLRRSTASDRLRFQRQRAVNIGLRSTAWETASCTLCERRKAGTSSSGNECWGPSDSSTASLLAAACSSKSKFRQNFLRSPRPSARLILRAQRGVDDELHPAALVEEPLEHDVVVSRQHPAQLRPGRPRR